MTEPAPDSRRASSVPFAVVLSVLSAAVGGALGAGVGWGALQGQVTRNREAAIELRAAIDDHHRQPGHPVALLRFDVDERRLAELERGIADMRAMREDVTRTRADVAALCRATRSANCGP